MLADNSFKLIHILAQKPHLIEVCLAPLVPQFCQARLRQSVGWFGNGGENLILAVQTNFVLEEMRCRASQKPGRVWRQT